MPKRQFTPEFKIMLAQEYLDGDGSSYTIAEKYQISRSALQRWIGAYRIHGEKAFFRKKGNNSYTKEYKTICVEEVLNGNESCSDVAFRENISSQLLNKWINLYNANKELKDYCPKREVYMAQARRKTTFEERKEITKHCIEHDKDYKGTAALYDISYDQIYSWVKKYLENGEEGLTDKRGRRKTDAEVDELERLRRENQRLKRKLEEQDKLVELLKKVKEFEGM